MAENNSGEFLGGIALIFLAVLAVIAAVVLIAVCGSVVGTGVGLVNYCKAFYANVRPERPGVS